MNQHGRYLLVMSLFAYRVKSLVLQCLELSVVAVLRYRQKSRTNMPFRKNNPYTLSEKVTDSNASNIQIFGQFFVYLFDVTTFILSERFLKILSTIKSSCRLLTKILYCHLSYQGSFFLCVDIFTPEFWVIERFCKATDTHTDTLRVFT